MDTKPKLRSALIIDDSAVQRNHAIDLLRQIGVDQVMDVGGGEQALTLLASLAHDKLPEVAIIDLEMPGTDGVQVIQRMRELGLMVPIIVASGRDLLLIHTVEAMAKSIGMPILGSIKKPLRLEPIKRLLDHRDRILNPRRRTAAQPSCASGATGLDAQDLRRALQDKLVVMHYQPKVSLQTGTVHGFEALARWPHPELGMVPPGVFIPLAEREGLIRELTLALIASCFEESAYWRRSSAMHADPKMAINLSPLLLGDHGLVDEIGSLVQKHGLQSGQIILEITEGSLAPNMATALATLARLRLKGFGLSIDDYGTGFSSMQQLAQCPFTELKIDRSFVCGAHERPNLRVILKSAIDMARQLELSTVGEGIESMEDWETLRAMGCAIGQGYLIAKPMPGAEVPGWLQAWQTGANSSLKQAALS